MRRSTRLAALVSALLLLVVFGALKWGNTLRSWGTDIHNWALDNTSLGGRKFYLPDGAAVRLRVVHTASDRLYATDGRGTMNSFPAAMLRDSRPEMPLAGFAKGSSTVVLVGTDKIGVRAPTGDPKKDQVWDLQSLGDLIAYCDQTASPENPVWILIPKSARWDQAMRDSVQNAWNRMSRKNCIAWIGAAHGGWVPR